MISADDVYVAFTGAGPDGLAMADINQLHKVDPTRTRILPTERSAAGRHLRQLLDADAIEEVGKGRWRAIAGPDWRPGDPTPTRRTQPVPQARPGVDLPPDTYENLTRRPGAERPPADGPVIDPALLQWASPEERRALGYYLVQHSDSWRTWIPAVFPQFASRPFAPFHEDFWDKVWGIEAGQPFDPVVAAWPRGAGKSTTSEMAVVALAARGRRRYAWYVSSTQQLSDEHVGSIASMLQTDVMSVAYPALADRDVDKYGHAKGWRRNRLRTADGFVVDALGLDTAARGMKVEDMRPDLIVLDDVDESDDTPGTVAKKIRAITRKILPAGARHVGVIAVQNLVHPESIFARLVSTGKPGQPEPAPFLTTRRVSGPIPAIYDLDYEHAVDIDGRTRWLITDGQPSWPEGLTIAECQHEIDTFGIEAFLAECQHQEPDLRGGWFDHLDFSDSGPIRVPEALLPDMVRTVVVVDPAVTSTDKSDSCGIVVMSLTRDRRFAVQWAWERIASPADAMRVAITSAIEFGAEAVVVETDQGGDTWALAFNTVRKTVVDEMVVDNGGTTPDGLFLPRFEHVKAGSTGESKRARIAKLRVDYDVGPRMIHVGAGAHVLERGLRRFPLFKPYDVVDACLVPGTMVATPNGGRRIEDVVAGDLVHTPMGPRPVSAAGCTARDAEVYRAVFDDGSTITGTFDHPVWTSELGWCPLGLLAVIKSPEWNLHSRSLIGAAPIAATRTPLTGTTASTTRPPELGPVPLSPYTGRSTSTTTGPSPTDGTSTTRITIPSTTPLTTWSQPPTPSTSPTTWLTTWPTTGSSHIWTGFDLWLVNGTDPTKDALGIASTAGAPGTADPWWNTAATPAASPSRPAARRTLTARPGAETGPLSTTRSTWSTGPAPTAAGLSSGTSTSRSGGSADGVARRVVRVESVGSVDVFNLEVPGPHSFVADGALVHNCYWGRAWLGGKGRGDLPIGGRVRSRAAKGTLPSINPSSLPGAR